MSYFKKSLIGFNFISGLLLLPVMSCANPNYEANPTANATAVNDKASSGKCPLVFSKTGMCASVEWQTAVAQNQEVVFLVKFWSIKSSPNFPLIDPPGNPNVILWMPDMGHGSSPVSIEKQAAGIYKVSKAYFIMPGNWEIQIQLKQGAQIVEQATAPVQVP